MGMVVKLLIKHLNIIYYVISMSESKKRYDVFVYYTNYIHVSLHKTLKSAYDTVIDHMDRTHNDPFDDNNRNNYDKIMEFNDLQSVMETIGKKYCYSYSDELRFVISVVRFYPDNDVLFKDGISLQ